jgi:thiamine kinase
MAKGSTSVVSPGEHIALGRTAEVYAWGEGQVLKLFQDWFSADGVKYEARIARAVHAAGLPVPAVGEIIEVGGRLGLIYERVDGVSMGEILAAKPWMLPRFARLLAELHASMHASSIAPDLPSQHQQLEDKIRTAQALAPDLREAVLSALAQMPDGDQLCHGDFHPGQVLMTSRGPVVIDWIDAARGNPLADVARSSVIMLGTGPSVPWLLRALARWFHMMYLDRYFQRRPGGTQEFTAWRPIVAAARLSEDIVELQEWLLAQVRAGLCRSD